VPQKDRPHDDPRPDPLAPYRRKGEGGLDLALALVRYLREHDPWDGRQTPRSLVPYLLEEAHETAAAIRMGDEPGLEEELGDLLLNVAFQIVIGEEDGRFDAASVVRRLDEKMRRRHPHLFDQGGDAGWEEARARERDPRAGILTGLEEGLPALLASHRIQKRVAAVGFDWPDFRGALEKLEEEVAELREALEAAPTAADEVIEELGDVLFASVNVARLVGAHADDVLDRANRKFRARFEQLETLARERSIRLEDASLVEMDALWDEVKAANALRRAVSTPDPSPPD